MNPKLKVSGLLISAGLSGRMGEFKPLMLYNNVPLIINIVTKLLSVCEKVIIVTGYNRTEIEKTIQQAFYQNDIDNRIEMVFNPDYEKGMFTSLQVGIKHVTDAEWVLYHFVDQPFHSKEFYEELISQIDDNYDWIQPRYKLKEGHPVLFKNSIFRKIIESTSEFQLKFIRDDVKTKKKNWYSDYPQILKDFDTKDDLKNFKMS